MVATAVEQSQYVFEVRRALVHKWLRQWERLRELENIFPSFNDDLERFAGWREGAFSPGETAAQFYDEYLASFLDGGW